MKKSSILKTVFYSFIISILSVSSLLVHANFDENDYELAIDEKRYSDALTILNDKADEKRTIPENELISGLKVVIEVNDYEWPKNSMALKEDEVEPQILTRTKKYLNAAIDNYLKGRADITRQILIQIMFIYPDYPKAKYFMTAGLNMPPGSYKVNDQVLRLIKRSDNYFYGGNYLKSAEDLEVLSILEREAH